MEKFEFTYQTYDYAPPADLETKDLFKKDYKEPRESPIDKFYKKSIELNKLTSPYLKPDESIPPQLANLILLGYVSVVESYFREVIGRLIFFDEASRLACEDRDIPYGAAISHSRLEELPEVLLENCSFANESNIKKSLREFLGIKGNFPDEVEEVLKPFSKVCQLRHCIVHRFGKLGSNNAIKLGLKEHKESLAKPINLDEKALQDIFTVCTNTVKIINDFLFRKVLTRSAREELTDWSWDFRKDKNRFKKYCDIFFSNIEPPSSHGTLKDVYNKFRKAFKDAISQGK
jgi:hypothetical protein